MKIGLAQINTTVGDLAGIIKAQITGPAEEYHSHPGRLGQTRVR